MSDPLLDPFSINGLELRNRLVSTSHEPTYSQGGIPGDRYLRYQEAKARGGIGLTMLGASTVGPESTGNANNIELHRDEVVPALARMADAVHEHGTKLMVQVTHEGRRTYGYHQSWLPLISSSHAREPQHRSFPKEAEDWDIARAISAFADAAERVQAAGLDGIELMAYGHLIDAFWSGAVNHRDDEWGGSSEGRARFGVEVLRATRQRVGPDFVVGVRMSFDDQVAGGVGYDDSIAICRLLMAEGLDFVSVIQGHQMSNYEHAKVIAPMGTPSAPQLEFAGRVRNELRIPTMHANRIADVATARHAVASGLLDLVGMTRAHIADPFIGAKIASGHEDRIRPCVGASFCVDRLAIGHEALCIHNPSTGREAELPHEITAAAMPRRAVVVGAGVAGLEAARVLAERGHDVTIVEANSRPGGQVLIASRHERRRDLVGMIDWRVAELERLGVSVDCNTYLEAAEVRAMSPDVVIVATGGLPNLKGLDAAGSRRVHSTWDVLSGEARVSGRVVVYDDQGEHQALAVAEFAALAGAEVEYVSPERIVGPELGSITVAGYLTAFAKHDVRITLNKDVIAARTDDEGLELTLFDEHGQLTQVRRVDHLVVENGTLPVDDVYWGLKEVSSNRGEVDQRRLLAGESQPFAIGDGTFQLFRVGDAVVSRNVHAAVLDSFRLCRSI